MEILKKTKVAILILDKVDFKTMTVTRDKVGLYLIIKGSIQEKAVTIVNIYALNTDAPKDIKQILTNKKGEMDSNTITVGDFNTPLTSMNRSSREKINTETLALNNTLDQMVLINIEYSIQKHQNTHSFQVHMEHSPVDHMAGHKTSLSEFEKTEIISRNFSGTCYETRNQLQGKKTAKNP